jgi:hypothetical protein
MLAPSRQQWTTQTVSSATPLRLGAPAAKSRGSLERSPATTDAYFAPTGHGAALSAQATLASSVATAWQPPAALVAQPGIPAALEPPPAPALPLALPSNRLFERALDTLPALATWTLVTAPFWAGLLIPVPFAVGVIAFDLFWLYLSLSTAIRGLKGYEKLRRAVREDWRKRYRADAIRGRAYLDWEHVRHIVLTPNYKETLATLRRTLDALAGQDVASQVCVVLAMEEREPGAEAKAQTLLQEYAASFGELFFTLHPAGLPGEVVGKSSNEAWAARIARRVMVDERGHDVDACTITSCDADTVFHPSYFACLTYQFATNSHRYRRFWQSAVLLNNNIWDVPAPLRVGSALSGVHILSNLVKRDRMVFPQSSYSLSLRMAQEAGYWDPDVIPEDWHMFLKCFFTFSGQVEVEPIFLPTGNDGVRASSYPRSMKMAYIQHKRHAWGACDIPYAIRQSIAHTEIPFRRKGRRLVALASNHLIWSTHWFLLTLGWLLPLSLADLFGIKLLPEWLPTLARVVLSLCAAPYVIMIFIDGRLRPQRPPTWTALQSAVAFLYWWLLPVTSLLFSTIPALESQTRLMLGKRLEYRVTEKS